MTSPSRSCPSRAPYPGSPRHRVAQLGAAEAGGPSREGRGRRLLHVHVHQLAAIASLRPRLGRAVPDRRARDRSACTRPSSRSSATSTTSAAPSSRCAVTYPVVVDNDYGVWNAFANHYWPALYFVDAAGRIRHHRFGEGDYERSEVVIQQLLGDAGADDLGADRSPWTRAVRRWRQIGEPSITGETYLGYRQAENFASPGGMERDTPKNYEAPQRVRHNHWALSGEWTVMAEATVLNEPKGRVAFRFDARDVHLVMGPRRRCFRAVLRVDRRRAAGRRRRERPRRRWIRRTDRTSACTSSSGNTVRSPIASSRSSSSTPERRSTRSRSADGMTPRGTEDRGRASVVTWVVLSSP